jgi:tRNA threonylcarbamoyladenosine biosynthesis protein TsaB
MRILAIDCALDACAAAVLDSDPGTIIASQSRVMLRGHAEALMPLIARVMDEAAVEFSELDRIAVTVGPGSFTGLRVGISAARGIALAAGKPAIGLTTLAGLAAPHIAEDDTTLVLRAHLVGPPRGASARGGAGCRHRSGPHRRLGGASGGAVMAQGRAAARAGRPARCP